MIEKYLQRMREQLSDYEAYAACLAQAPQRAIRANTLKISADMLENILPFPTDGRVEWEKNGIYIHEEKPGKCLYHDAGLFYVQEPSAMCAVPLLRVQPGERVLDLCAAPGGKSTQIAQAMKGEGILVLNEKMPDRARILLQNVERMGVRNAIVTCVDPEQLAQRFVGYFDKILVDAPCSGEGMFRKESEAAKQWSEENVEMCAARQKKILHSAAKMLAPEGQLVYSTCTFSEEEDERNAEWFVRTFPEFVLLEQRKIYPHRDRGEGHFAVLFQKKDGETARLRPQKLSADKKSLALYRSFEREFLRRPQEGNIVSFGNMLSLVAELGVSLNGLKVLRAGLLLGEDRGGRFEPSHALALGTPREDFLNISDVSAEDAMHYIRGEELPGGNGKRGWCAVAYGGYPLGLGKIANAVIKNHYPKGLRHNLADV